MSEKTTKDVIYVDVEDDITDVVNKIKSSKERIIAIVPPKSLGVFRSAVNIRLLSRTAQKADKKIVFVTNNSALKTMSAAAKIPVAKTLLNAKTIATTATVINIATTFVTLFITQISLLILISNIHIDIINLAFYDVNTF